MVTRRLEKPGPILPELFADRAVCVMTRIGQTLNRMIEIRLAPLGIKLRHYTILRALSATGVMSQHELGELLSMDPATTATTVDELERDNLVARERRPANRRKYAVELTTRGRRLLSRAEAVFSALESDVLAELGDRDRRQLRKLLAVLAYGRAYPALAHDEEALALRRRPR
jgi:DNA-binding MarR family transcriptional regulator